MLFFIFLFFEFETANKTLRVLFSVTRLETRATKEKKTKKMRKFLHKTDVYACVDVETSGPMVSKHGILAVGMAVSFPSGMMETYCFPVELEAGKCFDPTTRANFWNPHSELLEALKLRAEPIQIALGRFLNTLDYYDRNFNVTLVLDNPGFDCAFLNDAIDRCFNRKGICYALDTRFRMVTDMRSFGIGVFQSEQAFQNFRKDVLVQRKIHITHSPDQDCFVNLQVYLATLDHINRHRARRD